MRRVGHSHCAEHVHVTEEISREISRDLMRSSTLDKRHLAELQQALSPLLWSEAVSLHCSDESPATQPALRAAPH